MKNFTQEHVVTQLGLTTHEYSKIEADETQLTINRLNEIIAILGIDPIELLGFEADHLFNSCKQEGDNNTMSMGTINNYFPDKIILQYEERIKHLESEILFLRSLVK